MTISMIKLDALVGRTVKIDCADYHPRPFWFRVDRVEAANHAGNNARGIRWLYGERVYAKTGRPTKVQLHPMQFGLPWEIVCVR